MDTTKNRFLLELKNICKRFGKINVLKDINLSIHKGEILALLGDNGAGKSTLIKIISGLIPLESGNIFWEGNQIIYSPTEGPQQARQHGIKTVHQHLSLVNELSLTENFFLGNEITNKSGFINYLAIARIWRSPPERFVISTVGSISLLKPSSLSCVTTILPISFFAR